MSRAMTGMSLFLAFLFVLSPVCCYGEDSEEENIESSLTLQFVLPVRTTPVPERTPAPEPTRVPETVPIEESVQATSDAVIVSEPPGSRATRTPRPQATATKRPKKTPVITPVPTMPPIPSVEEMEEDGTVLNLESLVPYMAAGTSVLTLLWLIYHIHVHRRNKRRYHRKKGDG